jgi:hypothetical protein
LSLKFWHSMIKAQHTNYTVSKTDIYLNRAVSYVKSTLLLQSFSLGCLYISYINFNALATDEDFVFNLHLVLGLYFSSLVFTTQLDAYSRYQNYKMAKDLMHQYGFRKKLIKIFSKSRCQRDAFAEAARSLGYKKEIDSYFYNVGFRWYHILPVIILKNPTVLLTKEYWMSTLFVSNYKSKYFYW